MRIEQEDAVDDLLARGDAARAERAGARLDPRWLESLPPETRRVFSESWLDARSDARDRLREERLRALEREVGTRRPAPAGAGLGRDATEP
jgi:hypothetical protein